MRELAIGLIGVFLTGAAAYMFEIQKVWPGIFFMVLIFVCILVLSPTTLTNVEIKEIAGDDKDGNINA